MNNLLIRSEQHADECINSYLIRISEANDFKHIGHMLKHGGLGWKNNRAPINQLMTGEYDIIPCFRNLGLKYTTPRTAKIYQALKNSGRTTKIFTTYPKVCPKCLEKYGYCKDLWSLLPYTACYEHKILLLDYSPTSNKRLSWYRYSIDRFKNRNDEKFETIEIADKSTIALSKAIAVLVEKKQIPLSSPKFVQTLNLSALLQIITFLAHYKYRLSNNTAFNPGQMNNSTLAEIYGVAWNSLKAWPQGFNYLLEQYMESPMSQRGKAGINKHFRDIHEQLYRLQDIDGIHQLKQAFDHFIESQWLGYLQTDRLKRIDLASTKRDLLSQKQAASILNCRPERLKKLCIQNRISVHEFKGKQLFYRKEIENFADIIASNWSMSDLCESLQITRYQAKQLLDAKIIRALQHTNTNNRDWLIDKNYCHELISKLIEQAQNQTIKKGISLQGIQHQGFNITEVVNLMTNRSITYNYIENSSHSLSLRQFDNYIFSKSL